MDTFSVMSGPLSSQSDSSSSSSSIHWNVVMINGEEELSGLFSFHIQLVVRRDEIEAAAQGSGLEPVELGLVGQSVSFRMGDTGITRFGLVSGARADRPFERDGQLYAAIHVDVVPHAWLLQHRRNSRVFQGMYVHQIVSAVLCQAGVKHRWNLGNIYPKRLYCIQYDETDYEFVTRLLAEAGILFFFEHVTDEEKFRGGAPPTSATSDPSGWEKVAETAKTVADAAGTAGSMLGSEEIKMAGSVASIVSDFASPPPKDEEAEDPIVIGDGEAGPPGVGNVMVFIDQAAFYAQSTPATSSDTLLALTLREDAGFNADPDQIRSFTPMGRVRSNLTEVRDYDFRRPMLLLQSVGSADAGPLPAGAVPLEVYESHGEYEKPEVNSQMAQLVLEQLRADALTASGTGFSPRISPGHVFRIENTTAIRLPEDRYAVVRVKHESYNDRAGPAATPPPDSDVERLVRGCARAIREALSGDRAHPERALHDIIRAALADEQSADVTYQNRFECVPASIAYRPPRPKRITRNVTETATVVGPKGQEIHTDRYGRIRIKFHWDRDDATWYENASCWVRVIQPWAGAGFGFQFIPRVGMEVLVTFLGGDPDQPVVIGSLYNATHLAPEPLPQRQTRSGIRSQSSPGGGGFNEISFEDQAGVERVYIHAQKDLQEIVNDTHSLNVRNNQSMIVNAKQQIAVGADQLTSVGGSQAVLVGKNQAAHVQGDRTASVVRNETELVEGNTFASVAGVSVRSVKTDDLTLIEGDRNVAVHGNSITHIGGRYDSGKSNSVTYVQGNSFLTATDRVLVKAEDAEGDGSSSSIRLECGDSFIELRHDKITISAENLELLAGTAAKLKGNDSVLKLDENGASLRADPIELKTPAGAELRLDGRTGSLIGRDGVSVLGRTVRLSSGQSQADTDAPAQTSTTNSPNLRLVFTHLIQDNGGSKIANTPYRLIVEDLVYEGRTDGGGLLAVWVPDTAKVVHVTLWANETYSDVYPSESGPLHWLVHLVDQMHQATDVKGARLRLRNLGYDPGTDLREDEIDGATAQAILEFQLDRDLPADGKLDDATKEKLSSIYGS